MSLCIFISNLDGSSFIFFYHVYAHCMLWNEADPTNLLATHCVFNAGTIRLQGFSLEPWRGSPWGGGWGGGMAITMSSTGTWLQITGGHHTRPWELKSFPFLGDRCVIQAPGITMYINYRSGQLSLERMNLHQHHIQHSQDHPQVILSFSLSGLPPNIFFNEIFIEFQINVSI